jgi:pilus assembly protein CpaF
MLTISVTTPKGQTSQIECTIDQCSIGKSDDNLIVLQGWTVAKKHASIVRKPDGVYVDDLGSSSGTEVAGKKVTRHGPLRAGEKISIAGYVLVVQNLDEPSSAPGVSPTTSPATSPATAALSAAPLTPTIAVSPAPTYHESPPPVAMSAPASAPALSDDARDILTRHLKRIHQLLIKQMDLRRMDVSRQSEDELRANTQTLLEEIVSKDRELPPEIDRVRLIKQVLDEVVGLGPLEDLLADDAVTEIMVNRFDEIFVERSGRLSRSEIAFTSDQAVVSAIERIVAPLGRRIDESSPMVDARLKDGSRVNAVIPPLALKGANITIRKFSKKKLQGEDMVRFGSMTHEMLGFMKTVVEQKANIIISGGTGSGKTTLLNLLSSFIPPDERIITVEDAAELQLYQPNLIGLESRPANAEGKGLIAIRDLVKNTLRMRPDRIVVGECRGGEALDMLTAMNTGHDGSLTTAHANTPRDCLARIEVMVMMAGLDLPVRAIREQIASAIRFFIQQNRFSCGSRKITHITEVTGMEGDMIQLQDIFVFKQEGFGADGKVRGKHVATGAIPDFYQDLKNRGMDVDLSVFQAGRVL